MPAQLCSVRVGKPQEILDDSGSWTTAFHKVETIEPVHLSMENLDGDEQADRTVHGGPEKAICVYSAEHYEFWRNLLTEPSSGPGWFGENFTVADQNEHSVCIGDIYEIGSCRVQVSQPRGPCWKLAKRWNRSEMVRSVVHSGKTGWYLRVLDEGWLQVAEQLTLRERPYPQFSVARVNELAYSLPGHRTTDDLEKLAECAALATGWRERFRNIALSAMTSAK